MAWRASTYLGRENFRNLHFEDPSECNKLWDRQVLKLNLKQNILKSKETFLEFHEQFRKSQWNTVYTSPEYLPQSAS